MQSYYIYILQCSDSSYYVGVTNDVEKRYYEHQEGLIEGCYTHNKGPLKLVHVEEFTNVFEAIAREKQIKGWTRRKKKALIAGNHEELTELSRSYSWKGSRRDPSTGSG